MTESVLKSIMRLFALVANLRSVVANDTEESSFNRTREISGSFLDQLVNPNKTTRYLDIFDFHYKNLKKRGQRSKKKISLFSVKTLLICEQMNNVLTMAQKSFVLFQLIDILRNSENIISDDAIDMLNTIASILNIPSDDYDLMYLFIFGNYRQKGRNNSFLIISGEKEDNYYRHHLYRENLDGILTFLYLPGSRSYYVRHEQTDDNLYINGKKLSFNKIYIIEKGTTIRCPKIHTIHHSDITSNFLHMQVQHQVQLAAIDIEFYFKNSDNGIKKFSFEARSGQLLGIMGGSGVGKSTLINILNGTQAPHAGKILVNGVDIYQEREKTKGLVGFIPQDDFLIEELTVFENLYFSARFCFSQLGDNEIKQKVDEWLNHLNLIDIRDLKVGDPLNKFISGGQRKRLNIALELMREPSILFVDEPTSGLSSNDSEKVIELLKQQTYQGKLVVVNIHQPSSDIFKMFDSLLVLDKGGRCVYYGDAIDSLMYFRNTAQLISAGESECVWCGNLNPEQILQIIELPKVNADGKYSEMRQVSPEEWHQMFQNTAATSAPIEILDETLPKTGFHLPTAWKQFLLFFERTVKCKISDHQYMVVNLLEAPLLAIILGFFTRYAGGPDNSYLFIENINLPSFIFMSIVVALFLGMMSSAEEIIRDAKILKREAFLNLSHSSYLNSKVLYVFGLSAIQMMIYILISHFILEIKGMQFHYWLILFSTAACANIIGLILSAGMKSVVAIYISIPLLLIPQLLLNGVIVKYDKLNSFIKSDEYVPFVGDIMPSRWAYEALSVDQFANNKYQKHFFIFDKSESDATYVLNYWIPELINKIELCKIAMGTPQEEKILREILPLFRNEFPKLAKHLKISPFKNDEGFIYGQFNLMVAVKADNYLKYARNIASKLLNINIKERDLFTSTFASKMGGYQNVVALKEQYFNNSLADQVLNKNESKKIIEKNHKYYRKFEPVYYYPESEYGRAQYYAPVKKVGIEIPTFWFNLIIIWVFTAFSYLLLFYNALGKIFKFLNRYNNT